MESKKKTTTNKHIQIQAEKDTTFYIQTQINEKTENQKHSINWSKTANNVKPPLIITT